MGVPVQENETDPAPEGFRVVNAVWTSDPIDVKSKVGDDTPAPHGTFDFGNSPTEYIVAAFDHLWTLEATEVGGGSPPVTFDFTSIDLLSVRPRRTIFVSGLFPETAIALACVDTTATQPGDPTSSSCFLFEGEPSP